VIEPTSRLWQRSAGLFLAGLVVQLISWLMWLFFGWLKLILTSRLLPGPNQFKPCKL
jgi:hypothetical protein